MKGIVFSEFIEMVENKFSPEIADAIIEDAQLPSGGAYTAVGTYDHAEIITLVTHLSEQTGLPVADLVKAFGAYLAGRFTTLYPAFFQQHSNVFEFLETIENHVHVEVRKLYPDAELPTFDIVREPDNGMSMIYRSHRPFADLAEGLIIGCAEHFGDTLSIRRADEMDGDYHVTEFSLERQ